MKKSMNLREMKKALRVKTHIKAGAGNPRYAVVCPGQGSMNQNHTGS